MNSSLGARSGPGSIQLKSKPATGSGPYIAMYMPPTVTETYSLRYNDIEIGPWTQAAASIYEAQIEESCLELDIPFLPLHKAMLSETNWLSWIEPDGIHLNSEGHYWIYQKVIYISFICIYFHSTFLF